jgi:hypothetical protein
MERVLALHATRWNTQSDAPANRVVVRIRMARWSCSLLVFAGKPTYRGVRCGIGVSTRLGVRSQSFPSCQPNLQPSLDVDDLSPPHLLSTSLYISSLKPFGQGVWIDESCFDYIFHTTPPLLLIGLLIPDHLTSNRTRSVLELSQYLHPIHLGRLSTLAGLEIAETLAVPRPPLHSQLSSPTPVRPASCYPVHTVPFVDCVR